MLAKRADEILRQLLAHILITADGTPPDGLPRFGLADLLRLRFDMLHIILIGCRGISAQDLHVGYFADKHGVRTQILRLVNLY